MIHFTVGKLAHITSLAGALRHFGVSASLRRRIKHQGQCYINGKAAYLPDFVQEGDVVTVELPETNPFLPQPIPVRVAYEDEYLLVVDKPAGLLMHPTSLVPDGTLANAIAWYYQETGQKHAYHPMHRLDKNTSGLCLIAKEPQIQSAFDRGDLGYQRLYAALTEGAFPARMITVRAPIARCPDSIITRRVDKNGKAARSDFTCIARSQDYSLVHVRLFTGRTHQIRVHASYLGYPLVGDDLYGGKRTLLTRQALHAYCVRFLHPMTRELITVNSPLPLDMLRLIQRVGWNYTY